MHKKQLLLLLTLFVSSLLFAKEKQKEIHFTNEQIAIEEYKVKLSYSIGASYGFTINKERAGY
ncbi:MAG: hypothetical protein WKG06_31610 [Segetibacter sp.]